MGEIRTLLLLLIGVWLYELVPGFTVVPISPAWDISFGLVLFWLMTTKPVRNWLR